MRRPDALLNAQFWAEDGAFWYADAYNAGPWISLFQPENGYFQTISRLVAGISLLFPLRDAPLFFNVVAITIQALPVVFLWSKRFAHHMPSVYARIAMSILYLGIPNSFEVNANITNAHWKLALLAFMILISKAPSSRLWSIFDYTILILASLSGPFSVVMAPLALIYWGKNRNWHTFRTLGLIGIGGTIQLISVLIYSKAGRSSEQLAANWDNFTKIFGGQVIDSSMLGMYHLPSIYLYYWMPLAFTMLGITVIIYVLARAKLEVKLFIAFTFLVFTASLASPMISVTEPQWEVLTRKAAGVRYYFLPIIGWFVSLVWLANQKKLADKAVGVALILISLVGIKSDFQYSPLMQSGYPAQADKFQKSTPGTREVFLLNPGGITMTLVKK